MEKQKEIYRPAEGIMLGSSRLVEFFVRHLSIVYAVKIHLAERLPELSDKVHFKDLYLAVQESIENIEKQIKRIENVFKLLNTPIPSGKDHVGVSLIDYAFNSIRNYDGEPELQDLAILFYIQNIESLEMSSFQILQMAAVKLKNEQVKQLIKENFDEAKEDRTLFLLIASKYLVSHGKG